MKEPSRANCDQINADHEARIVKLEKTAVEHTQEFRLVIQHIDKSMEAQRQEFSAMLERQLAAAFDRLRVELEAKIDASHRYLEAKIDASHRDLEAKIAASHRDLEAKIDATGRNLEAKIATLEKLLWGAIVIVVTMFGIAVTIFGSLGR
jgi:hypothetical protein